MWTFRRNEKDVVKLYDSLSELMRIATGGNMLNFGFWEEGTSLPLDAQKKMCEIFAQKAQLNSNQSIVDIGSGLGDPAFLWCAGGLARVAGDPDVSAGCNGVDR